MKNAIRYLIFFVCLSIEVFGSNYENINSTGLEKTFITNRKRLPDLKLQSELRSKFAWKGFVEKHEGWNVEFNEDNGMPHSAFGKPIEIGLAENPEALARSFIQNELTAFNIPLSELKFQNDAVSNDYHHLNFTQEYKGLQVLFSKFRIKMTLDFKVVLFGADVYNDILISILPKISKDAAIASGIADLPNQVTDIFVDNELKILPIPDQGKYEFKLVYTLIVATKDENGDPAKYYTLIDALNAEVLYRDNQIKQVGSPVKINVAGTLYTRNPYRPSTINALQNLKVEESQNIYYTDSAGDLTLPNTSTVVPTFYLESPWVQVLSDQATTPPVFSSITAPGDNFISFDNYTSTKHLSLFYHVNLIHDFMKKRLPQFTGMDFPLPARVDIQGGSCNAFYTGTDILFYQQGGGCNSLAEVSDVIYHEYGHGITIRFYKGFGASINNSAMGEGYSDTWALSISNNPIFGVGNYDSDSIGFIRRYDKNKKVYPKDIRGESHADGEIICGAWWDCALNLGSISKMTKLFTQSFFALPDAPNGSEGQLYTDILIDALQADDGISNGGDNDISNGSPNSAAISRAFALHGISVLYNGILSHTEIKYFPSNQSIPLNASLSGFGNPWAFDGVKCIYKINNSANWDTLSLINISSNNWTINLASQVAGTLISYFLCTKDIYGNISETLPIGANASDPNLPYYILVGSSIKQTENFENYLGNWQAGLPSDNAIAGAWVIANPIPSYTNFNDPNSFLQTPNNHTIAGSICAVTGNASASNIDPGTADVDGGKTSLQSPPFDLSMYVNPSIEYYRCYTNIMGYNPGNDSILVEVSSDNINWKTVEHTQVSEKYWKRFAFRVKDYVVPSATTYVRFVASDYYLPGNYNGQSLVEAAVDDFSIFDEDLSIYSGDLSQNNLVLNTYPNPVSKALFIDFYLKNSSEIKFDLYTPLGQNIISFQNKYPEGKSNIKIDVNELPQGIYILNYGNGIFQKFKKINILR